MRALWASGFLVAGACMAQAGQISGTYADEAGCGRLAGLPDSGDVLFILTPERVERYESSCAITDIEMQDGVPTVLQVACEGEGETWTDSYLIAPLPEEDGFMVSPSEAPEIEFELRRCP